MSQAKPNVIIMYADDLGFGDVGCYGATGIPTPNIDRLAAEGVLFRNGYATAATCTPSRYSLLTGSYPWRNPRAKILNADAAQIIDSDILTMPRMFQRARYRTGIVGKWHLGLGDGNIDWNAEIRGTPNDVGFDESYIMAATNDRVPCVYVHNRRVDNLDPDDPIEISYEKGNPFSQQIGRTNPELLKMMYSHGHDDTIINGVSRIGHMRGGTSARWTDETMCDVFLGKAVEFISKDPAEPFFLYYAFHEPHVPRLPSPRFAGATKLGPRGDVIVEMDWCVGQLLNKLEELGLRQDTIVIFSSDNGPVLDDGYQDEAAALVGDHKVAGPLRGGKYSLFDGGTRVPFIVSWPGTVTPGVSDALICHVDFHASFANLIGLELDEDEALDSLDVLDALLGRSADGRSKLITEGIKVKTVVRDGDWTYIPAYEGPAMNVWTNTELGNADAPQLYNLKDDIGQIRNRAEEAPERVAEMAQYLDQVKALGRSRIKRHLTQTAAF